MSRRFPVYLLLDTSSAMEGKSMALGVEFIRKLFASWRENPIALESLHVSLITFGSSAKQDIPLTDISQFKLPPLQPSGFSALGKAFALMASCRKQEAVCPTPEKKGDWLPTMILVTGSRPTDNWQKGLRELQNQRWANLYACVIPGSDVDTEMLQSALKSVFTATTAEEFHDHARTLASHVAGWDNDECPSGSQRINEVPAKQLPAPPPIIHVEL